MISRCFGHVFVVPGKGMDELPACTGFLVRSAGCAGMRWSGHKSADRVAEPLVFGFPRPT